MGGKGAGMGMALLLQQGHGPASSGLVGEQRQPGMSPRVEVALHHASLCLGVSVLSSVPT